MSDLIFFQDFLFDEIPIDNDDNPKVNIKITNNLILCPIFEPSDNFDSYNVALNFSSLLEINTAIEWEKMLLKIDGSLKVVIIDDIPLKNIEIIEYKNFYLKTYYYLISQRCNDCYIYKDFD